ncbi:MAG: histidine phosphatase family protein [Nitrospirales bacterium]|nr:histidine phosphatase family protein [Nitrospirales bacterium]
MHCLLFRHGIAVSPHDWDGSELSRPLTKEGIIKTQKAAEGLYHLRMRPTHILCSPLTRTQETAQIAKEILACKAKIQLCPELVFDQSPLLLFPILNQFGPTDSVLCVGHEPHLGQTAAFMISGKECPGLSLKKAGAVLISFAGEVKPGYGELEWWVPPAQLRMLCRGE